MANRTALLLFSGGQDSATCLIWAVNNFDAVETIGFSYGQRHSVELDCRKDFLSNFKAAYPKVGHKIKDDLVINLDFISEIGKSALTENIEIGPNDSGLPNTFVPGRNIFFLATAASVAYKKNISDLVGGMCETDYSGYPDCRLDTIRSLEDTLQKGMEKNFKIHTPLMSLSKAETWRIAENWGGKEYIEMLKRFTHTCYLGERDSLHDWGYGCSKCPACELRMRGYEDYRKGLK